MTKPSVEKRVRHPTARFSRAALRLGVPAKRLRKTAFIAAPHALTGLILGGTVLLVSAFTLILIASVVVSKNYYVLPRLAAAVIVLGYVGLMVWLFRKRRFRAVAWLLIAFYALLGTAILLLWSINAPVGILVLCFVLILSSVMLGARFIIPTTAGLIVLIGVLWLLDRFNVTNPDTSGLAEPSSYIDVATYATLFIIFAIVSWLSGRRMEQSLERALQAEADLARERDSLEVRLEARTRELREAQLEETRALYRFAELGQLGTVLLHDLANNLTALTLDIDDIGRQKTGDSVARAKESIAYLEGMVAGVRRQINENDTPVVFDARFAILETLGNIGPKARRAGVTLEYDPSSSRPFYTRGDRIRFAHILTILVTNAIEAYGSTKRTSAPSVVVTASEVGSRLMISVTDYGKGITPEERDRLFVPFHSTKPDGMGIGLFMAREMAERYLKATLTLDPGLEATTFVLSVPRTRRDG